MDPTPAGAVQDAIEAALAIEDPEHRAREVSDVLGAVQKANKRLKETRRADILLLRETKTLREVADLTGLSIPRIDQIAKGK